jgi:hypothetical protein
MIELLKYIVDVVDSLMPSVDITECAPENSADLSHNDKVKLVKRISQDIDGCRKAHKKIEVGEGTQITPFVKIADYVDDRDRKSTAVQIRGPLGFGADISGCVTEDNKIKSTKKS